MHRSTSRTDFHNEAGVSFAPMSGARKVIQTDDEILALVPPEFHKEDFNPMKYVLENLPEKPDIAYLDNVLQEKDRMLDVVNSKLSTLIMNSYGAFVQGMSQIHELDVDLQQSAVMCRTGRNYLHTIKEELTNPSLVILAKYRKQQAFTHIMNELIRMKLLLSEEAALKRLLAEGDYPSAISKCLSCQAALGSLIQYNGVRSLSRNFGEHYRLTQDKLDAALQQLCCTFPFSPSAFQKVVAAYRILGKPERMLERLQPFFIDTVEAHTAKIVKTHVLLADSNRMKPEVFKMMPLRELCASLDEEQYGDCLRGVLEYLCDLLAAHYSMSVWLSSPQHRPSYQNEREPTKPDNKEEEFDADLLACLSRIARPAWDNMQRIVALLLLACKPGFKIEEFLKTLDSVYKFVELGEEFSGAVRANALRNGVRQQSRVYFSHYHKSRVDDLRTMMEHEMWHRCPLQPDFSLYDVKEFRAGLRRDSPVYNNSESEDNSSPVPPRVFGPGDPSHFPKLNDVCANGNPFAKHTQSKGTRTNNANNNVLTPDDDSSEFDTELNLRAEIHRTRTHNGENDETLVTPTTINVVRFMGRYLQLMRMLPNPQLVWRALTQLFEYYLYSVYALFSPIALEADPSKDSNTSQLSGSISSQLRRTLQRLKAAFDHNTNSSNTTSSTPLFSSSSVSAQSALRDDRDGVIVKCGVPKVSENVSLTTPKDLYGLSSRVIAIESLRFLTDAIKESLPLAQTLIPTDKLSEVDEFYSDTVSIIPDLRSNMYRAITHNYIHMEQYQHMVGNTKWELKELGLDHNAYVDQLLKEFREIARRLDEVERENDFKIPTGVRRILWEHLTTHAMEALVEGYSRVKKCNNEGRALMSLDLKIFTHSLQNLINSTGLKPPLNMGSVALVENYIKAFYLPPSELVVFSKDHPEYSSRQIQAILACNPASTLKKKQRREICTILDDIEKSRTKRY